MKPLISGRFWMAAALGAVIALVASGSSAAGPAKVIPPAPCATMRVPGGTLESSLKTLAKEKGFEVTFANPEVARLSITAGTIEGPNCVAAVTSYLEAHGVNFALTEGRGKTIRKLVVVDFKGIVSPRTASAAPAEAAPMAPEPQVLQQPEPVPGATNPNDKAPDPDELIDRGNGMKEYKIPPPYVPMSPGLVPPNAVVAGSDVLAEGIHGAPDAPPNAVVTPGSTPATPQGGSKKTPFPGSPVPPNAHPVPTPTPHS